jgi:hypothetical protein
MERLTCALRAKKKKKKKKKTDKGFRKGWTRVVDLLASWKGHFGRPCIGVVGECSSPLCYVDHLAGT